MEKNLTQGNVLKTIITFSVPFFLSKLLQTLYGLADLFIIGQFESVASTTAVSVGSQVMHMMTAMIIGLALGATVMIGRAIGADQKEDASKAIGNTAFLFLAISIVLMFVLLLSVDGIVSIMSTPAEAAAGTKAYLIICFVGIPFITAYNIISAIFRGLGDSKTPMYFVAIACVVNIILDYIFIGGMGMGPAGAALGTTLSQSFSVVTALYTMKKRNTGLSFKREYFRPDRRIIGDILKVGLPVCLQDGFIQIAFLVITMIANQRGLVDAAAVGIVEKVIGIIFMVPSSMLATVSALAAQNIGAGLYDRAKQVLKYAVCITAGFGIAISIVTQFVSEPMVALFTDSADVVVSGGKYLRGYVFDCIFAGIHFCFSGFFCACGYSGISFLHNSVSIVTARIPLAYLASVTFAHTLFPMGIATTIGSAVSVIICVIAYIWLNKTGKLQIQTA